MSANKQYCKDVATFKGPSYDLIYISVKLVLISVMVEVQKAYVQAEGSFSLQYYQQYWKG